MSQVDYLLMMADAARLAAQRPELDEELIQAIWRHLLMTQGRQPTLEDVQAYIDRVSSLDERTIRLGVGLGLRAAKRRRNRQTEPGPRVIGQSNAAAKSMDSRETIDSDRLGYPTLEEIEAKRRELAAAGRPHGFDALGGKSTNAPFPGQRSTIRRRYLGLPPPGSWIPGICDTAPRHPHPRPT